MTVDLLVDPARPDVAREAGLARRQAARLWWVPWALLAALVATATAPATAHAQSRAELERIEDFTDDEFSAGIERLSVAVTGLSLPPLTVRSGTLDIVKVAGG